MFLVTSPIVINVPTRGLLAVATMHAIFRWLTNLNIKRNMTSMFVNKKHHYTDTLSPQICKNLLPHCCTVFIGLNTLKLMTVTICSPTSKLYPVYTKSCKGPLPSNNEVHFPKCRKEIPHQSPNTISLYTEKRRFGNLKNHY